MITNDPSPLSNSATSEPTGFSQGIFEESLPVVFSPDNPPWGIGRALLAWIISVACLLLVPLVLVIPYMVSLSLQTGGQPSQEDLLQDKIFLFLSILGVIPAHALTLGVAWALITRWGRFSFSQILGFSWPRSTTPLRGFGICLGLALLLYAVGIVITYFIGGGKTQIDLLVESSYQARLATAFLAVVTAPLVEEVIYRGMLYPALQRTIGTVWGIAVVSILFSGVHVYQYWNHKGVILVITVLSVALTVIRAVSGRLLPSIVVHLIFNGITAVLLLVSPYFEKPEATPPPTVPALVELVQHLI